MTGGTTEAASESGFPENSSPFASADSAELGRQSTSPGELLAGHSTPLVQLDSYANAVKAFSTPLGPLATFPTNIHQLVEKIKDLDARGRIALERIGRPPIFRQVFLLGSVLLDTHRLMNLVNTKESDDWLSSTTTLRPEKEAFRQWRSAFLERYHAIRALNADIFLESNLDVFEQNPLRVFLQSIRKIADVFAGKNYWLGTLGVGLGMTLLSLREIRLLLKLIGSPFLSLGRNRSRDSRYMNRVNALAGEVLITSRHSRRLGKIYALLDDYGVVDEQADTMVLAALRQANHASSKPWKGLVKLNQMILHSNVDPRRPDFLELFQSLTAAPVQYTHTPGLEWVVRDYEVGKSLLQQDGRIPAGQETATLQQGRVSLFPGIATASPRATEFARRYFGPVENFLNSMVTADGADHQRLRKPFLSFFSRRAVFERAPFVDHTVKALLAEAEALAKKNGGAFDFKKDFAFQFPIRIICEMVGIRGPEIERIQRWTEESTRSMDTEAGVTLATATRGHRSVEEQRAFFGKMLEDARKGNPASELIGAIATDATLSESERISNLSVIIFAGFETTTGLLCNGVRELLKRPEQWRFLLEGLVTDAELEVRGETVSDLDLRWYRWAETEPREADPDRRRRIASLLEDAPPLRERLERIEVQESRLEAAVEEMLRWCAPGSIIPLTASQDFEITLPKAMCVRGETIEPGGKITVARGETVTVAVDELNRRCPFGKGEFDKGAAGEFDISRSDNRKHLSFGVKHMCIGASLARENAKRALEGVLRRFPDLELDGVPVPQDMELFHGLASLPVRSRSHSS